MEKHAREPRTPRVQFHKASRQFRLRLSGKDFYLGHDLRPAEEEAQRLLSEWSADGRQAPPPPQQRIEEPTEGPEDTTPAPTIDDDTAAEVSELTIKDLVADYLRWSRARYVKDGQLTGEHKANVEATGELLEVCRPQRAAEFSPKKLKAVVAHMLKRDISRKVINARAARIKRLFKWAVSEELVPPSVFHGISTVVGLRKGQQGVREAPRVKPVAEKTYRDTIKHLPPLLRGAAELMWHSAARPHEILVLRPRDVDRTDSRVWVYVPGRSKVDHLEVDRRIYFGPAAQQVLGPLLEQVMPTAFVFDPRRTVADLHAERRRNRETPLYPSHVLHQARKSIRRQRLKLEPHYSTAALNRAIGRAVDKANAETVEQNKERETQGLKPLPLPVERWSVYRLRHAAASRIRKAASIEAAQVILGHRSIQMAEHYAQKNEELGRKVAAELG